MTVEKIILSVCEEMSVYLNDEQVEQLKNTLFVKFHGIEICEPSTALQTTIDAEEQKLIDYFKVSKAISGRQKSTISQYVRTINSLRMSCGKLLTDINSMDLRWYFGMCKTKYGNAMSTVQSKRLYLNSFYSFLYKEGVINNNPVEKIEPMKVEKRLRKAFNTNELEKLREACGNDFRSRALIEFLLSSGLRVSECCSLNVGDIDLGKQEFTVIGKGNKQRNCYINETGTFYLLRYLNYRMGKEGLTQEELSKKPLFVSSKYPYSRVSKRTIEKILKHLGENSGVENVHPHRFRRTFASILAVRGCPLQDLRVLMGHSNIDTTMHYCDIKDEQINISYKKYGTEA